MTRSKYARMMVFKRFVTDLESLSKCTDKHVAAIIIDKHASQVYSIGVNGGPKGGPDCLCTLGGKYTCAHAEANAIAKCPVDCKDKVMICTMAPCITCATLIINSGIKELYYIHSYHDITGIKLMLEAGLTVVRLDEKGYAEKTLTEFEEAGES